MQKENMKIDHLLEQVNIAVFRKVPTRGSVAQSDRGSE